MANFCKRTWYVHILWRASTDADSSFHTCSCRPATMYVLTCDPGIRAIRSSAEGVVVYAELANGWECRKVSPRRFEPACATLEPTGGMLRDAAQRRRSLTEMLISDFPWLLLDRRVAALLSSTFMRSWITLRSLTWS